MLVFVDQTFGLKSFDDCIAKQYKNVQKNRETQRGLVGCVGPTHRQGSEKVKLSGKIFLKTKTVHESV